MTDQPVTATVSEPVRAKRPTLYAVLKNSAYGWAIIRLGTVPTTPQDLDIHELLITIPGDDAPSGWRPASEPPDNNRSVLVVSSGQVSPFTAYFNDGLWRSAPTGAQWAGAITHWMELPTPPGAKA